MVQNVSIPGVSNANAPARPAPNSVAKSVTPQSGVVPVKAVSDSVSDSNVKVVAPESAPDSKKDQPDPRSSGPRTNSVQHLLSIAHDDAANRYVYRGVDNSTKEVQGQWPSEQSLKQIALLREMSGQLFDEES